MRPPPGPGLGAGVAPLQLTALHTHVHGALLRGASRAGAAQLAFGGPGRNRGPARVLHGGREATGRDGGWRLVRALLPPVICSLTFSGLFSQRLR